MNINVCPRRWPCSMRRGRTWTSTPTTLLLLCYIVSFLFYSSFPSSSIFLLFDIFSFHLMFRPSTLSQDVFFLSNLLRLLPLLSDILFLYLLLHDRNLSFPEYLLRFFSASLPSPVMWYTLPSLLSPSSPVVLLYILHPYSLSLFVLSFFLHIILPLISINKFVNW